jgi:hypothetical protein
MIVWTDRRKIFSNQMSQHHGKKQHHTWSLFIHLVPSLLTLFYCYKKHLCKPHLMLTNTRRATFEGVWILVSLWPIGVENWEKPRAMALQDLVDWKGRPVNPKRHGGVKATMFIYCKQPCLFCFFLFLFLHDNVLWSFATMCIINVSHSFI